MDLNAFVEERRPRWRRLEQLVARLESSGARGLVEWAPQSDGRPKTARRTKDGVKNEGDTRTVGAARELGQLYREACADLIRARSETANAELIGYLNGLVG